MSIALDVKTFATLYDWIDSFEDQTDGLCGPISEIGEPYREFFAFAMARPGDEKVAESTVATMMQQLLGNYFAERTGRIYWRIRLEHDISNTYVVTKYDVNGPDIDFVTDRKCFKDANWRKVGAYCRVVRAKQKIKPPPTEAEPAVTD